MRQWAMQRWPEATIVDLKADLPHLKAESVIIRQQAEAATAAAEVNSTPRAGTVVATAPDESTHRS
jgi:hypothetical protein